MATPEPLIEPRPIAGAIVPGDGYFRFCRSTILNLRSGDWVVIESPLGTEPGRVVFAPGNVDASPAAEIESSISRFMTEAEVSLVATHVRLALSLVDEAARIASRTDPDLHLLSLHFSLDGSTIFCHCYGTTTEPPSGLAQRLSQGLGLPVQIRWSDRPVQTFGSLGRIHTGDRVAEQVIRDRLGIATSGGFPKGWPRLGARVGTPLGTGRLIAVSVRHDRATIRLDSGEETEVSVERLTALDG